MVSDTVTHVPRVILLAAGGILDGAGVPKAGVQAIAPGLGDLAVSVGLIRCGRARTGAIPFHAIDLARSLGAHRP